MARNNREISEVQFRQTVVNTIANVRQLYYDLLYAIDNLEAQRKSLALARRLLEENQIRVRVGTMAPLDVVAAESEVAGREEAVILAEAAVLDAEDAIKRAIFPENDPETWATRIVPTDRPTAEPVVGGRRGGGGHRAAEAHRPPGRAQGPGERGERGHARQEPAAARSST